MIACLRSNRNVLHLSKDRYVIVTHVLSGYDAAAVIEVIEHLDKPRLAAFERVLFEYACPTVVVLTTPNVEYNIKFENLPAGKFRHRDHRFEWTRSEFESWGNRCFQTVRIFCNISFSRRSRF